jgi:hypothetical protein
MHRSRPATGKITGTGAVLAVTIGFKPCFIQIYNETQLSQAAWVEGMADDSALAVDDSGADTTNLEAKSADGITPTSIGFSLGADADLNTADDVIYYVAW